MICWISNLEQMDKDPFINLGILRKKIHIIAEP